MAMSDFEIDDQIAAIKKLLDACDHEKYDYLQGVIAGLRMAKEQK